MFSSGLPRILNHLPDREAGESGHARRHSRAEVVKVQSQLDPEVAVLRWTRPTLKTELGGVSELRQDIKVSRGGLEVGEFVIVDWAGGSRFSGTDTHMSKKKEQRMMRRCLEVSCYDTRQVQRSRQQKSIRPCN